MTIDEWISWFIDIAKGIVPSFKDLFEIDTFKLDIKISLHEFTLFFKQYLNSISTRKNLECSDNITIVNIYDAQLLSADKIIIFDGIDTYKYQVLSLQMLQLLFHSSSLPKARVGNTFGNRVGGDENRTIDHRVK